ncbi:methyltransferase domain-containing protein [Shimia gijangensis]
MKNTPQMTDRRALIRNRTRADHDKGMFLQEAALEEVQDRLTLVNKAFTKVAIVSAFPDLWRRLAPQADIISDEDVLELAQGTYDLVVHAMCLHWANDPVGQIIQCRRALKADGFFLSVSFGGQTLHELRASLAEAEAKITGGLSPRVAPMGEIRDLGAILQRAGLALPVADAAPLKVTYETPWHLMRDLRSMGEANALAGRLRRPTGRQLLMRAVDVYIDAFMEDGRIPATFELIFLSGWAPDSSQPQPLRPGSATTRLADALGADETPLKD